MSQPYRARAVSESRRDPREPSSSSHEAEGNRLDIVYVSVMCVILNIGWQQVCWFQE